MLIFQNIFITYPLSSHFAALMNSSSVQQRLLDPEQNHDSVLTDLKDGRIFRTSPFFLENPNAIQIILFQDAFELVNPLGSAKKTQNAGCILYHW
jgi:hypothetical protein